MVVLLLVPELLAFLRKRLGTWMVTIAPATAALVLSLAGLWLAPIAGETDLVLMKFAKQVVQLGVMLAFVVVPIYFMSRGRSLTEMAGPLVLGAVFQGCYGAAQGLHFYVPSATMAALEKAFTSNPSILAGSEQLYLGNVLRDMPRLRGTACEPLYLGNYLLLAVPLVWLTSWRRWLQNAVGIALIVVLVLTWSRGAWLAGAAAGALFLLVAACSRIPFPWRRLRQIALAVALAGVVITAAGTLTGRPEIWLPWQRLQQTFSTVDWSNLTRLYSMQAAWRGFLLSPVVGLGWGQFGFHFPMLVDPMGLQSMFSWPVVNNFPLAILCETGLLGFGAFLHMGFRMNRNVWLKIRDTEAGGAAHLLVLAAAVSGVWLQLLTFSQYNLPHIWLAVGLLTGLLASPDTSAPNPSRPGRNNA